MLHGLHSHGDLLKMSRTVPSSLGAEAQAMSVAQGFVEWATLFLQKLIHGSFDLRGVLAVMQERPPVCLYDHLLAVGSPKTLQDKRSAVDVLISRESVKKTGCVIRWAPTWAYIGPNSVGPGRAHSQRACSVQDLVSRVSGGGFVEVLVRLDNEPAILALKESTATALKRWQV